jgi:hypothetical protein
MYSYGGNFTLLCRFQFQLTSVILFATYVNTHRCILEYVNLMDIQVGLKTYDRFIGRQTLLPLVHGISLCLKCN